MATFSFSVSAIEGGELHITLESGETVVMVGANGSGKTRLATELETSAGLTGHRIAAHRALALNPEVPKISEQTALHGLRTGWADTRTTLAHRDGNRWGDKKATRLLNDYDFLVQALYAEQSNTALQTHAAARQGVLRGEVNPTKLERLKKVWELLLPSRRLLLSADSILVQPTNGGQYSAADMSDGERAIFYMLGQALVAADSSVLIVDEPELHVHPAIMDKLWDAIQAERPDCAFIFITHDLAFASARPGKKYAVREYVHTPKPKWSIEAVPKDAGFDEELVTLILGSRRPVLFVEGTSSSLDAAFYRACFPDWTIIPRGSCEGVIHSVVTMRRNATLTRVSCSGLVDADDYAHDERSFLDSQGIGVLPVSEIENLVLLPSVSREIALLENYLDEELQQKLEAVKTEVFALASSAAADDVVLQYCRRRIDRALKKIDLSEANTVDKIAEECLRRTGMLDIRGIAQAARQRISSAIETEDLPALLQSFGNKGALLSIVARHLRTTRRDSFEEWLIRALNNNGVPGLVAALRASLPQVTPR